MANLRLIVLIIMFEVLTTVLVVLGIYFGVSTFPFFDTSFTTGDPAAQTISFNATIPLNMPTLTDIKVPYTHLQSGTQSWVILSIILSAVFVVLQSFVRGMYLGGLKGWVQQQKTVPLLYCGRKYFKGMLAWSIFQLIIGFLTFLLAAAFFPLALILIICLIFFSLTPYLIVLQEIPFSEALSKSPQKFTRYFWSMFPLALLALLLTFIISLTKLITSPWGYALPLVTYALVGNWLVGEFVQLLIVKLQGSNEKIPEQQFQKVDTSRISIFVTILLIPILVTVGIVSTSGKYLSVFDLGNKDRFEGISYNANFSDIFYISDQRYTAYEWQSGDYYIDMKLPDLSSNQKPQQLRGIADITWQINEEVRTVNGNTTNIDVQPFLRESKLLYRLVQETALDGTKYYSTLNGSASIIQGSEHALEPLSVQVMVSGDGNNIFVFQYPSNLDISQVFNVSNDGQFLIPRTSHVNPMYINTYWFSKERTIDEVFELLKSKNKSNDVTSLNKIYIALAVAMQEADGNMVSNILEILKRENIDVNAPNWRESEWTDYLRNQYEGASLQRILDFVTKVGTQFSYGATEVIEKSNETITTYFIKVPFPNDTLTIQFEENKEDGRMLSITVID
ncbi:MAG: hypothetical protein NAG76_17990 [Candidatus Pristimantibacillus lignocellulolyticus]|uniref:Uncharacterized protein n=1 Tax=Candidatus Pristimantibacillus lignocellulolyticus TaxID=2994561 RepID=A0A9J6ZCE9_9BACL|nr:MAG: hypothetical protein NAG76_17990 [Candidatus Pristimantibacillus lignocellulolyticus]